MAFIKEVIIAALFTAIAVAQLPNIEVPALPANQSSIPAIPETPAGNNTQIPAIPEVPNTNGTVPVDTGAVTVPPVPGQEGSSTEAPSRLMNAINTINGMRGNRRQ